MKDPRSARTGDEEEEGEGEPCHKSRSSVLVREIDGFGIKPLSTPPLNSTPNPSVNAPYIDDRYLAIARHAVRSIEGEKRGRKIRTRSYFDLGFLAQTGRLSRFFFAWELRILNASVKFLLSPFLIIFAQMIALF